MVLGGTRAFLLSEARAKNEEREFDQPPITGALTTSGVSISRVARAASLAIRTSRERPLTFSNGETQSGDGNETLLSRGAFASGV